MGEFAIFDRSGIARFFISENVIYDYSGRPVAFLEGENIVPFLPYCLHAVSTVKTMTISHD